MLVMKRWEALKAVRMMGVLGKLVRSVGSCAGGVLEECHCGNVRSLGGCGLSIGQFLDFGSEIELVLPQELTQLPLLERLYLGDNKLTQLPAVLGEIKSLKVLNIDNNMLVSLPVELKQCVMLVE